MPSSSKQIFLFSYTPQLIHSLTLVTHKIYPDTDTFLSTSTNPITFAYNLDYPSDFLTGLPAFFLSFTLIAFLWASQSLWTPQLSCLLSSFKEPSLPTLRQHSFSPPFLLICSLPSKPLSLPHIYLCDGLFILIVSLHLARCTFQENRDFASWFILTETRLFQKQNGFLTVPQTCQAPYSSCASIIFPLIFLFLLGKLFPRHWNGSPLISFTFLPFNCCLHRQTLPWPSVIILPRLFSSQHSSHLHIQYSFVLLFTDNFHSLKYNLFSCLPLHPSHLKNSQ